MHRRQLLKGIPAIWLAAPVVVAAEPVDTLELMLERLRHKIHEDMPDLSNLQINYDPSNAKVPLMVVALRV